MKPNKHKMRSEVFRQLGRICFRILLQQSGNFSEFYKVLSQFAFRNMIVPLPLYQTRHPSRAGLFLPNAHSLFRSFGSEWLEERGDIRRYVFLLLQDHELYINLYIFNCFIHLESSSTSTLLDFTCEENNLFISTVLNG